jgi:hypothetical protein
MAAATTAMGWKVSSVAMPASVRVSEAAARPMNAARVTSRFTRYRLPICTQVNYWWGCMRGDYILPTKQQTSSSNVIYENIYIYIFIIYIIYYLFNYSFVCEGFLLITYFDSPNPKP